MYILVGTNERFVLATVAGILLSVQQTKANLPGPLCNKSHDFEAKKTFVGLMTQCTFLDMLLDPAF